MRAMPGGLGRQHRRGDQQRRLVWTPSATGATVAASEINSRLAAGTPVAIYTTGGGAEAGDIFVNSAVGWSANLQTLSAYRNVAINASLSGSDTASLALEYGQGAAAAGNASDYTLSGGAQVNLPAGGNFSAKLGNDVIAITYTVIIGLGAEGDATVSPATITLQGMRTGLAGHYVLGDNIDASGTNIWNGGLGFNEVGFTWGGNA